MADPGRIPVGILPTKPFLDGVTFIEIVMFFSRREGPDIPGADDALAERGLTRKVSPAASDRHGQERE